MGQYEKMMQELRASYLSGKTKSEEWRLSQLMALHSLIKDNEDKICDVLYKDLHKSKFEASVLEIGVIVSDVIDAINNLQSWMKPEKVSKGTANLMDTAYMLSEPLGVTLVISAWNYPMQVSLLPLVGAIAAGNCAVLKPSEMAEHTAQFLEEYIPKYLDKDCFRVVNGGVPETTALLQERFDLIFYTGNSMVGKIIMTAASKFLTPVVLELGGKSPVFIDEGLDLKVVTKRLAWGKFINAGQTCVAPDYVLCTTAVQEDLIKAMKETLKEFYTENPQQSESFARIINERHLQRLLKLKEGSTVAIGGTTDEKDKYFAPTVVRDAKPTDNIMQDEIFGPLLAIMPVKDHNEAINVINQREKPLSMYVFTNRKEVVDDFRIKTSSGGLLINDTIVHCAVNTLPFGGVGHSGIGAYHGKHTFDCFSHRKAVLEKNLGLEKFNELRYPPYSAKNMSWLNWVLGKKIKKRGALSFLPFMVLGTVFAMMFKTLGVTAQIMESSSQQ